MKVDGGVGFGYVGMTVDGEEEGLGGGFGGGGGGALLESGEGFGVEVYFVGIGEAIGG